MHTLIRFTLGLAALAFGAILPASADPVTESRAAAGFTGVALSAPIRVDLVLGESEGVVLEGEAMALSRIETTVENGVLRIRMKALTMSWNHKVRARVTARRIEALSIAGSGDIHAQQVTGDALKVSIAGSGDVVVGGGKVGVLTLSIAGSGDISTARLEAQRVKVSISGSGDATVWARQSLSVSVAGSGDVHFYGDPAVEKRIAGSGEIKRLGAAPS